MVVVGTKAERCPMRRANRGGPAVDAERFDRITKSLASRATRRRLVGGLSGGILTAVVHINAAGATCREVGSPCTERAQCCGGKQGRSGCRRFDPIICPDIDGRRCCLKQGVRCVDTCSCCNGLACTQDPDDPLQTHCQPFFG